MKHYGYTFESRPPIFIREIEMSYCPTCFKRMWPSVPPSDYARNLLAIVPVVSVATARATTCCQCQHKLAS